MVKPLPPLDTATSLCQFYLARHKHDRGWNIFDARDEMVEKEPADLLGRLFAAGAILQIMHQLTCKRAQGMGDGRKARKTKEQLSLAFDVFGVDPAHSIPDDENENVVETDEMTEAEFDEVIDRCDEQIKADQRMNNARKIMRNELRPIFRKFPKITKVGEAIAKLLSLRK